MPENGRFKALFLCRCDNFVTNDDMSVFCWGNIPLQSELGETRIRTPWGGGGLFPGVLPPIVPCKFPKNKKGIAQSKTAKKHRF